MIKIILFILLGLFLTFCFLSIALNEYWAYMRKKINKNPDKYSQRQKDIYFDERKNTKYDSNSGYPDNSYYIGFFDSGCDSSSSDCGCDCGGGD